VLGKTLSDHAEQFATFWPPSGVALAALLLTERRSWLRVATVLALVNLALNLSFGTPFAASVNFTSANLVESLVGASAIGWVLRRPLDVNRSKDVLVLMGLGGFASTAVGAAIALPSLSTFTSPGHLLDDAIAWWSSDALGILILTPLLLVIAASRLDFARDSKARILEACVAFTGLFGASLVSFHVLAPKFEIGLFALQPWITLPILLWIALRFGTKGIVVANLELALVAVASFVSPETLADSGNSTIEQSLAAREIFLGVRGATFLVLAAIVEELREERARAVAIGERKYKTLANAVDGVLFVTDANGSCEFVNDRFAEITGITFDDSLGFGWTKALHADDVEATIAKWESSIASEQSYQHEYRLRTKDGSYRWFMIKANPLCDEDGKITHWFGFAVDFEDRKRLEGKLRDSETRLKVLVDSTPSIAWVKDSEGRYVFLNKGAEEKFQATMGEWRGKTDYELLPNELAERFRKEDHRVLETGEPIVTFETTIDSENTPHHWRHIRVGFTDSLGAHFVAGVGLDVTTEMALEEERQKFFVLAESSLDYVSMATFDGAIFYLNPAGRELIGIESLEEARTKFIRDMIPPDEQARFANEIFPEVMARGKWSGEGQLRHARTGELIDIRRTVFVLRHPRTGEPFGIGAIITDIGERKRAEAERRESDERFRLMAENIGQVFWISRPNAERVLYVSPAYETIWGRTCESLYEEPMSFFEAIHPDDRERVRSQLVGHMDAAWRREYRIVLPDGTVRWIEDTGFPIRDEAGEIRFITGFGKDITSTKEIEEQLRSAMIGAEAASRAKSEFLANMSHELRTPLNGLLGMSQLLLGTPLTSAQRAYVKVLQDSGRSLVALVENVLEFSRLEEGYLDVRAEPFRLRANVDHVFDFLKPKAQTKAIAFTRAVDGRVPDMLLGDWRRVRQVLVILLDNALKFTDEGKVDLQIGAESIDASRVMLQFSVRDTGIGIAPEIQEILFDPFTQADMALNRRYGGAGLGLAIAKRLVQLLDGRIWVESAVDVGSAFHVALPFERVHHETDDPTVHASRSSTSSQLLRVLIAEDNEINRFVATLMARHRGHDVTTVDSAAEFVEQIESASFDIAIINTLMPDADGLEVVASLRERERAGRPLGRDGERIPILVLTTHDAPIDERRMCEMGVDGSVAKPLLADEFAAAIERASRVLK